ncbi:MAG: hypothetical protein LHW59_05355 [Candidatus Cloacimonetes bacterium]|nr:hypothetical protein [Candidatus Cloacimonadota bacterium]
MSDKLAVTKVNMGIIPTTFNEVMAFSETLSKSGIIPKNFQDKPNDIFVAINWGLTLGLPPVQALNGIAVINGKPSIFGDLAMALVRASGKCEYVKETQTDSMATCIVKRVGEDEQSKTFTMDEARKAGLLSNPTWNKYPKRMLQMRARAFALRDVFADVLLGISIAEEQQDIVDTEVAVPAEIKEEQAPIDPLANDIVEAEVTEQVTVEIVTNYYKQCSKEKKSKLAELMAKHTDWRGYSPDNLASLLVEMQNVAD